MVRTRSAVSYVLPPNSARRRAVGSAARLLASVKKGVKGLLRQMRIERLRWGGTWGIEDWMTERSGDVPRTAGTSWDVGVISPSPLAIRASGGDNCRVQFSVDANALSQCDIILDASDAQELIGDGLAAIAATFESHPEIQAATFDDLIAGDPMNVLLRQPFDRVAYRYADHWGTAVAWRPGSRAGDLSQYRDAEIGRVPWPVRVLPDYPASANRTPAVRDGNPSVDVVIPTRFSTALLTRVVSGIRESQQAEVHIWIADNSGYTEEKAAWYERELTGLQAEVLWMDPEAPFNYAAVNNECVRRGNAPYVVLLNDDLEFTRPGWLATLIAPLGNPDVGIVGAQLLDQNGRIQHGGHHLGAEGLTAHVLVGCDPQGQTILGSNANHRVVSASTAAVMALRRSDWHRLGGFDERFVLTGNDVELCLRWAQSGLRTLVLSQLGIIHHESSTRGSDSVRVDTMQMWWILRPFIRGGDPRLHPELAPLSGPPQLASPATPSSALQCANLLRHSGIARDQSRPAELRAQLASERRHHHHDHHRSGSGNENEIVVIVPDTTDLDDPEVGPWLAQADELALQGREVTVAVLGAPHQMWATGLVRMGTRSVHSAMCVDLDALCGFTSVEVIGPDWILEHI